MNKGQAQWRHGYMTGMKRANGFDKESVVDLIDPEELYKLRRDSLLVAIMRDMGAFDLDHPVYSRPGAIYWHGTEQAFAILNDLEITHT